MEVVHGTSKASKPASEDVISSMPDNVITNIFDRLTIQDAVRTGILSRNWKFKWNMLTQLVFDAYFYQYLARKGCEKYYTRIIDRLLLLLNGAITKFYLFIDKECDSILNGEDFNNWILFLSRKGIHELTVLNLVVKPLNLHTHLFSCQKLKHLKLFNCELPQLPSFLGFQNLLSLHLVNVTFESDIIREFLTRCPFLEIFKISFNTIHKMKRVEIPKLENLKELYLPLFNLDNKGMITSSSIFQLMGSFPKLHELNLVFFRCKLLADTKKRVPTVSHCLKTLKLYNVDFSNDIMVSCIIELICGSPNLTSLLITAADVDQAAMGSSEIDYTGMGRLELQLRDVEIRFSNNLSNEVYLIKYLLACSPFLKKMTIRGYSSKAFGGDNGKLLKFHRASTVAEIDLL